MTNTLWHHTPHIMSTANYECWQMIRTSSSTSCESFSRIENYFPTTKRNFCASNILLNEHRTISVTFIGVLKNFVWGCVERRRPLSSPKYVGVFPDIS